VKFEAVVPAETAALEPPITESTEAAPLAAAPVTAQPERALRRTSTKSAVSEPLGALDISANPGSSLVLDGRPLGRSPRTVELPSGPHTVLFIHPERGRMSVTVNVRAGRTTSASANF
jgi:hypothetical protein